MQLTVKLMVAGEGKKLTGKLASQRRLVREREREREHDNDDNKCRRKMRTKKKDR